MTNSVSKQGSNSQSLFIALEETRAEIKRLEKQEDNYVEELKSLYTTSIADALKQKEEPFGVVHFTEGDFKVSFTTPKKVEYDQKGLEKLKEKGFPVKVKYDVSEAIYKELYVDFIPYRTVMPGKVSVKLERVE